MKKLLQEDLQNKIVYHIENINFHYSQKGVYVIREFSLDILDQQKWSIIGPSGCGKSTLLNLLAGLMRPKSGKILFNNQLLDGPNKDISIVFQEYGLFPWQTTYQNIELPLKLAGLNKSKRQENVEKLIEQLGLDGLENKYPGQLSGGQRQRVAIGRALIDSPSVLLMDEPFSALDEITREELQIWLRSLIKDKALVSVLVTHQIEEAILMGDKIIIFTKNSNIPMIKDVSSFNREDIGELALLCQEIRELLEG